MTRRDWLSGLATALALSELAAGSDTLSPIDEGGFVKLVGNHKGRALLIDFWATWCAPCREEMPKLIALHARYARQLDLTTISCEEPEAAAQAANFVAAQRAPMPRYIRQTADDDHFINTILSFQLLLDPLRSLA